MARTQCKLVGAGAAAAAGMTAMTTLGGRALAAGAAAAAAATAVAGVLLLLLLLLLLLPQLALLLLALLLAPLPLLRPEPGRATLRAMTALPGHTWSLAPPAQPPPAAWRPPSSPPRPPSLAMQLPLALRARGGWLPAGALRTLGACCWAGQRAWLLPLEGAWRGCQRGRRA
jgi:hypothetical protein